MARSVVRATATVVLGGFLVVRAGLIAAMAERPTAVVSKSPDSQAAAAKARAVVMQVERRPGFDPADRETEKLGYDIDSRIPSLHDPPDGDT